MSTTTESATYKKARRHYLKTRQHPETEIGDLTAFRAQEKKYKSRFPPPQLDNVFDPRAWEDTPVDLGGGWSKGGNSLSGITVSGMDLQELGDRSVAGKAYSISSHPGLIVLPGFLTDNEQRSLIRSCLASQARAPNETNLDVHYEIPPSGLWQHWLETQPLHASPSCPKVQTRAKAVPGSGFRASPIPPPDNSKRILIDNPAGDQLTPNHVELPPAAPSPSLVPLTPAQLLPKLRWANIGRSYHWGSKAYDFSKELAPFPDDVKNFCQSAVRSVPWDVIWGESVQSLGTIREDWGAEGPDSWKTWSETFEPDAGIVNFYQIKVPALSYHNFLRTCMTIRPTLQDTLMGHVDRSEISSTTPLVSISLGNAAIFLIGGVTRDVEPLPIILRSGDVVIMSGPGCRRAYHGVPRILEGTLPTHLDNSNSEDPGWEPFATYLQTTRINVNVRQVFPYGYIPGLS
ncbi:hypothetical protein FRB95_014856 [Tulasnella sp. JGI-2019a]|nr:hypothetical protein FRB95_014856 [Tulasnella sp. JGI-2019a]